MHFLALKVNSCIQIYEYKLNSLLITPFWTPTILKYFIYNLFSEMLLPKTSIFQQIFELLKSSCPCKIAFSTQKSTDFSAQKVAKYMEFYCSWRDYINLRRTSTMSMIQKILKILMEIKQNWFKKTFTKASTFHKRIK